MTKQERLEMVVRMVEKMENLLELAVKLNNLEEQERIKTALLELNIKGNKMLADIVREEFFVNELRLGVHWDKEPEELTNEELEAEQELVWRVLDETGYELPMEEWELCFLEKRGFYLDCEIHNREEESKKEKTFLESLGENKEEFLKEIANTF